MPFLAIVAGFAAVAYGALRIVCLLARITVDMVRLVVALLGRSRGNRKCPNDSLPPGH